MTIVREREKNQKILANLRSKTYFQQVGQNSARKLKNVKALGFCVNSTFAISRPVVYAYLSYKKGSIGDAQTIYGGTYAKKLP